MPKHWVVKAPTPEKAGEAEDAAKGSVAAEPEKASKEDASTPAAPEPAAAGEAKDQKGPKKAGAKAAKEAEDAWSRR